MDIRQEVLGKAQGAKEAAAILRITTDQKRNAALIAMVNKIRGSVPAIKEANAADMKAGEEAGLSSAILDRLLLTDERIEDMAVGLEQVAGFADPQVSARMCQRLADVQIAVLPERVANS